MFICKLVTAFVTKSNVLQIGNSKYETLLQVLSINLGCKLINLINIIFEMPCLKISRHKHCKLQNDMFLTW